MLLTSIVDQGSPVLNSYKTCMFPIYTKLHVLPGQIRSDFHLSRLVFAPSVYIRMAQGMHFCLTCLVNLHFQTVTISCIYIYIYIYMHAWDFVNHSPIGLMGSGSLGSLASAKCRVCSVPLTQLCVMITIALQSFQPGLVPRQVTTAATKEGTFALTQSVEGQWTRSPHKTGPHICSTPWRTLCRQSSAAREHFQTVITTNRSDQ